MPALELLVRARAERGELDAARVAFEDLERASALLGTPYLLGRVRLVAGALAFAAGDHEEARRASEDAIDRLTDARALRRRRRAARGSRGRCSALGRAESAARRRARRPRRVRRARRGARARARAEALLRGDPRVRRRCGELSAREVEVLRLVAQGLGDAEIAERLVLSPHTVHRHVANVRTKLRLPSRTAAVAYAARAGLL